METQKKEKDRIKFRKKVKVKLKEMKRKKEKRKIEFKKKMQILRDKRKIRIEKEKKNYVKSPFNFISDEIYDEGLTWVDSLAGSPKPAVNEVFEAHFIENTSKKRKIKMDANQLSKEELEKILTDQTTIFREFVVDMNKIYGKFCKNNKKNMEKISTIHKKNKN